MFTFINKTIYTQWAVWAGIVCVLIGCNSSSETTPVSVDAMVVQDIGIPETDDGIAALFFEEEDDDKLVFQPVAETAVSQLWSLSGKRILWRAENTYFLYENGQVRDINLDGFEILDAVYANEQLLVSSDQGLMVLEGDTFVPSPLNGIVTGLARLTSIDEHAFWLVDGSSIKHWRDGQLSQSHITVRNFDGRNVFTCAHTNGDELLIWEGLSARSIRFYDGNFSETIFAFSSFPTSIGLNREALWVLESSRLYVRRHAQHWVYGDLPNPMQSLHTHNRSSTVYFLDDSRIWRLDGNMLSTAPKPTNLEVVSMQSDGGLLLASNESLEVLNAQLTAILNRPPQGPLVAAHAVAAQLNITEGVESVQWHLDSTLVQEGSFEFELEPMGISPGPHTLSFSATLPPDRSVTTTIEFEGPPPWESIIQPIHEDFCAGCHGNDSRVPLLGYGDWVATYELILYDVETDRMPLTAEKLTPSQVNLIRGWGAAGFPRGENR